jgi:hypothetical protein
MRERAIMLGGWINIESSPRAGTVLMAKLPLRLKVGGQRRDERDRDRRAGKLNLNNETRITGSR